MFTRFSLRRIAALPKNLLAIETSCDDTCCAIFGSNGKVISHFVKSQTSTSVALGGIIPSVACRLHSEHIDSVVQNCLDSANLSEQQISAIAVTNRPGLKASLSVGVEYSKLLSLKHNIPIMPIHHMEAHALTARFCFDSLNFPYLCLLVSGGHMLLVYVKNCADFYLLGKTMDESPGDVYDKIARELGLRLLPELKNIPGGAAVERIASEISTTSRLPIIEAYKANSSCDFSLSGIHAHFDRIIKMKNNKNTCSSLPVDFENAVQIADCFQRSLLHHILKRVGRAIIFCRRKSIFPSTGGVLIVSGGVASNQFLLNGLKDYCRERFEYQVLAPPSELCTDNAIMIGWNALERLRADKECYCDANDLNIHPRSEFAIDIREDVARERIKSTKIQ